jgi:hypothetical protein
MASAKIDEVARVLVWARRFICYSFSPRRGGEVNRLEISGQQLCLAEVRSRDAGAT